MNATFSTTARIFATYLVRARDANWGHLVICYASENGTLEMYRHDATGVDTLFATQPVLANDSTMVRIAMPIRVLNVAFVPNAATTGDTVWIDVEPFPYGF